MVLFPYYRKTPICGVADPRTAKGVQGQVRGRRRRVAEDEGALGDALHNAGRRPRKKIKNKGHFY